MSVPFRLSKAIHTNLKEYSETTGVPMSRVAEEAVGDWLKTVGAARLEFRKQQAAQKVESPVEVLA